MTATPRPAFAQIASRIAEVTAPRGEGSNPAVEAIAHKALALAEATDMLDLHGEALSALAELDRLSGRQEQARERAARAVELHEQRGDTVSAARERGRLTLYAKEPRDDCPVGCVKSSRDPSEFAELATLDMTPILPPLSHTWSRLAGRAEEQAGRICSRDG